LRNDHSVKWIVMMVREVGYGDRVLWRNAEDAISGRLKISQRILSRYWHFPSTQRVFDADFPKACNAHVDGRSVCRDEFPCI